MSDCACLSLFVCRGCLTTLPNPLPSITQYTQEGHTHTSVRNTHRESQKSDRQNTNKMTMPRKLSNICAVLRNHPSCAFSFFFSRSVRVCIFWGVCYLSDCVYLKLWVLWVCVYVTKAEVLLMGFMLVARFGSISPFANQRSDAPPSYLCTQVP